MSSQILPPWRHLPKELSAVFGPLQAQRHLKRTDTWPRGQGQAVLVIPGFGASDEQTRYLRQFLRRQGYAAYGWGLGRNLGPKKGLKAALGQRLAFICGQEQQACHLVGWSLGGIFARELARHQAEGIVQLIYLGAPLAGGDSTTIQALFKLLNPKQARKKPSGPQTTLPPLQVPSTAIYTQRDGIVAWQASIEANSPTTSAICVPGSHAGLVNNPYVWFAISQRLSKPGHAQEMHWPAELSRLLVVA